MEKSFDLWNKKKKQLHAGEFVGHFHEREIWWCSLGLNIGFEQDGKNHLFERPVLIIRKFNRYIALVVPLTTKVKPNKYYFGFKHDSIDFAVILSQIRLVSSRRLSRRIRKINQSLFENIREKIKEVAI